jgi:hypothetical protein
MYCDADRLLNLTISWIFYPLAQVLQRIGLLVQRLRPTTSTHTEKVKERIISPQGN